MSPKAPCAPFDRGGGRYRRCRRATPLALIPALAAGLLICSCSPSGSDEGGESGLWLIGLIGALVLLVVAWWLALAGLWSRGSTRGSSKGDKRGGVPTNRSTRGTAESAYPPPPDPSVHDSVQGLEPRLSSLDQRVGFLQEDVSDCMGKIEALSPRFDSIMDQLAAVKQRVTALETTMNGLRNTELVALRSKAERLEDAVFHKPPPTPDPLSKTIQDAHLGLGGEVALLQRLLGDELADVEKLPRATESAIADQRLIDLFGTAVKFVNEVDEGRREGAAGLNTVVSLLRKDVPQWVSSHFGVRVIWPEVNARYDPSWKAVGYDAPPGSDLAYVDRISRVVSVGLERDGTEVQQCSVYRWGHAGRA